MNRFFLSILVLFFSTFFVTSAYAEVAGKVLFVYGEAKLVRADTETELKVLRGMSVEAGDSLRTGKNSVMQLKLSDGSLIALRPDTTWNLKKYLYDKQNPSLSEQGSELLKGGLRAVTGYIGKADPKKVTYTAGTVTIGIRGTSFELLNNLAGANKGVFVRVETGKVEISNNFGSMLVYPNEIAAVIGAKAPEAAQAQELFKPVDELLQTNASNSNSSKKLLLNTDFEEVELLKSKNLTLNSDNLHLNSTQRLVEAKTKKDVSDFLDNLDLSLAYYKIAFSLAGDFDSFINFNANHQVESLNLGSNKASNFWQGKQDFLGRGFAHLQNAYLNLPEVEKNKIAKLNDKTINLYNNLKTGLKFNVIKAEFSGGNKLVFLKYKETVGVDQGISSNKAFIKHNVANFTMPTSVYTYSLRSSSNIKIKTSDASEDMQNSKLEFRVNFSNKKFLSSKLTYKYENSGSNYEFNYKNVNENSYILDSGVFYLAFDNLTIEHLNNTSKKGNFRHKAKNKFALAGTFLQSASTDGQPNFSGVFGAYVDLKNTNLAADLNEIKHIGYVNFSQ